MTIWQEIFPILCGLITTSKPVKLGNSSKEPVTEYRPSGYFEPARIADSSTESSTSIRSLLASAPKGF